MKKNRLFVFISLMLALVTVLCSCGGGYSAAKSFDVVLNEEYSPEANAMENFSEIVELKGMQFLDSRGEFMTFSSGDADTGITISVFSTRNKKVVFTATSSSTEAIEVNLYSKVPAFTVVRTLLGGCADAVPESACELYDATGALIVKTNNSTAAPISLADELIFELVAYKINSEDGSLTKRIDVPENLYLDACDDWNGKYIYTFAEKINVYSRDFSHVYGWTYPSWAERLSVNTLNDGSILVQYLRPLDNLSEKYDIYETDEISGTVSKYDLFSVRLDPERKEEKELKLDCVIQHISTEDDLILASEDNGMYADGFENIAQIVPIVDSQLDNSDSSADIVVMDNGGKIKKSLKILDGQGASLPTCVSDGVYIVSTIYGSAFVDINGELLHQINNTTVSTTEKNIIIDGCVYTFDMKEVYSLHKNNAEMLTYINGTVLVRELGESENKIIAISGEEITELGRSAEEAYFEELTDVGCYSLFDAQSGKYEYYNSNHKLLHTSSVKLESVASDFVRNVTIYAAEGDSETSYYIFY